MRPNSTPSAALYVRVSSKGQEDEGSSLATQEASCRASSHDRAIPVDGEHIYRETHTGTELWERPQLTRLRAAMARGEVTHLFVHSIDRLSRDPVHLGVIISEADHRGVEVIFVTEPLDSSPEGQLVRFVRGYAAKVEHEKIRERTLRGRRARAESGKLMHGRRALFGYQYRDAETKAAYDLHPVNSLVVRRIFQEYCAGYSLRRIAQSLADDGIPSPSGRPNWSTDPLRRILRHPSYKGEAYAWGFQRLGPGRVDFKPENAIALPDGTVPAIVSVAVWERAQERLETNKHGAPCDRRLPDGAVLLRGQIVCGHCHGPMSPFREAKRGYIYRCRTNREGSCGRCQIAASEIDDAAWRVVVRIMTEPEFIAREVERMRRDDAAGRDLTAIDAAIATVDKQRANLARVAAMLDDAGDAEPIVAQLQHWGERRRQLVAEREAVAERVATWEQTRGMLDDIARWGAAFAATAAELSPIERRALVELFGVRATVYRKGEEERFWIRTRFSPEAVAASALDQLSYTSSRIGHLISLAFPASAIAA
jgi:site-specific DNA recombinase